MPQLPTAELKNVEILDTGTWSGSKQKQVTTDDIDQMIVNFKGGVAEPYVTLDHNDSYSDKVKNFLKVASLGWVSDLRREGTKLIADFKQVPAKIAELIQNGMLKKRSVEYWPSDAPYRVNGADYPNTLTAVTFFGADQPAVNSLSDDFEVLMLAYGGKGRIEGAVTLQEKLPQETDMAKSQQEALATLKQLHGDMAKQLVKFASGFPPKAEPQAGDAAGADGADGAGAEGETETEEVKQATEIKALIEKVMNIIQELLSAHAEASGSEAMEAVQKECAKYKADLDKANAEIVTFKAQAEKDAVAAIVTEAQEFVQGAVKGGKILPKAAELTVKQYVAFKQAKDETSLAVWKEDISNRPDAVIQGQINFQFGDAKNSEAADKPASAFTDTDAMMAEVKRVMARDKVDFKAARDSIMKRPERLEV